jgi:hypothetical protein
LDSCHAVIIVQNGEWVREASACAVTAWPSMESRNGDKLTAAFVVGAATHRAPATRMCTSPDEGRRWVESEAAAIGIPVEWIVFHYVKGIIGKSVLTAAGILGIGNPGETRAAPYDAAGPALTKRIRAHEASRHDGRSSGSAGRYHSRKLETP